MWIAELTINPLECSIHLTTTAEPDKVTMPSAWRYVFRAVGNLQIERYHDTDNPCLGDFCGIHVHELGDGRSRYRLDTGDAWLTFEASTEREVNRVSPDAPDLVGDGFIVHDPSKS